jgi:molecular chaperone HscB
LREFVFRVTPQLTTCWNCGKNTDEVHFCDACHSLQPPATEYYAFFGLERKLNLDRKDLERRFYTLSRRLHPDVYFRRSPREQQYALDAAAVLNDAYRTLRNPVARAEYLLKLEGCEARDGAKAPPELLEEVFEMHEALAELKTGDNSARPRLAAARDRFIAMRDDVDRALAAKFAEFDAGVHPALQEIHGILQRRKYVCNLIQEVYVAFSD